MTSTPAAFTRLGTEFLVDSVVRDSLGSLSEMDKDSPMVVESMFAKVPDEIISHIFTLGSDDEPYGRAEYSQPRHIKPYIDLVAQVCRRWNIIMSQN